MTDSEKNISEKPEVLFILSVDVEEEWDWSESFPHENFSLENIKQLPNFQLFCEKIGIRPTYFVDYAVANDNHSVDLIRKLMQNNKCEIGAHLHPWCNPPIFGKTGEKESHVVNLPLDIVEQKLDQLNLKLKEAFNQEPCSYRSGRWGINAKVLKLLASKGYNLDSSIYPYYSNEYFSCENPTLTPYWPDYKNSLKPGQQREIFEIPITAGFNRSNYALWSKVHQYLTKQPFRLFRTLGFFWHIGLLKKLYLSPELTSTSDMITLVNSSLSRNHQVIHMYLHSPSLLAGATEYAKNKRDVENNYAKISTVINHLLKKTNLTYCTISEAKAILNKDT